MYHLDHAELDKANCSDIQLSNISLSCSLQSETKEIKDIFNHLISPKMYTPSTE